MTHIPGIISCQSTYVDLEAALVFKHGFDGTAGNQVHNFDETGKEISTNANSLIADTSPTPAVGSGYFKSGLGRNDLDSINSHQDFNFSGDEKFTIEFYVYPVSAVVSTNVLMIRETNSTADGLVMYLDDPSGNVRLYSDWRNSSNVVISTVLSTPDLSQSWHKIKYNFDGTTHRLYLNDSQVDSVSESVAITDTAKHIRLVSRTTTTPGVYEHYLDEITIYKGVAV